MLRIGCKYHIAPNIHSVKIPPVLSDLVNNTTRPQTTVPVN